MNKFNNIYIGIIVGISAERLCVGDYMGIGRLILLVLGLGLITYLVRKYKR